MKKHLINFALILSAVTVSTAQSDEKLPYAQIPDYPETYTAETVAARLVDGLGYRYYWATEGLTNENLEYRPSDMARSTEETLDHIYGLTSVLLNACKEQPNDRRQDKRELNFEEKRKYTLANIQEASNILRNAKANSLSDFNMIFLRDDGSSEFPFWNLINGPIADAIWHVGQIISFRRSSGNPMNSKASMLRGKLRE